MATLPDQRALGAPRIPQVSTAVQRTDLGQRTAIAAGKTAEDIGQVSKVIGAAGEDILAARARIQTREDVIARANAKSAYKTTVSTELRRKEVEEDITTQDSVNKFTEFRGSELQKIMDGLEGVSPDAQAQIYSDLTAISSKGGDLYGVLNIKAGREKLLDVQDQSLTEKTGAVSLDPDSVLAEVTNWETEILEDSPGQDPNTTRDQSLIGSQQLISTAMNSYVDKNQLEKAEALRVELDGLGMSHLIDPKTLADVNKRIATRRLADTKFERDAKTKDEEYERVTGETPNKEQRLFHRAMLRSATPPTAIQKVNAIAAAWEGRHPGKSFPDDMWNKAMGVLVAEKEKEKTLGEQADVKNPSLGFMIQNNAGFAGGSLSTANDEKFKVFAEDLVGRRTPIIDRVSKKIIGYETRVLPPTIAASFRARGLPVPGVDTIPVHTPPPAPQTGMPSVDPQPVVVGEPPIATEGPGADGLFAKAENLTGPINTITPFFRSFPVVGQMIGGSEVVQNQRMMANFEKDLVTAYQNSPKFADMERRQIKEMIDLMPHLFDNPANMRDKMIAMDDTLTERLGFVEAASENGALSPQNVDRYRVLGGMLKNLQKRLNVPPRMTPADAIKAVKAGEMVEGQTWLDSTPGAAFRLYHVLPQSAQ